MFKAVKKFFEILFVMPTSIAKSFTNT
jgi:hypothetical protein